MRNCIISLYEQLVISRTATGNRVRKLFGYQYRRPQTSAGISKTRGESLLFAFKWKRGLRVSLIQLRQSRQGFLNKYTRTANNNSGTTSIYFSDRKSELMQSAGRENREEWEHETWNTGTNNTAYATIREKSVGSRFTVHALREKRRRSWWKAKWLCMWPQVRRWKRTDNER